MVRGLSQRPNLTKGPAAMRDFWRTIKEEEEEEDHFSANLHSKNNPNLISKIFYKASLLLLGY
jgi:hypothetical protein